jgi:hypothetical protein
MSLTLKEQKMADRCGRIQRASILQRNHSIGSARPQSFSNLHGLFGICLRHQEGEFLAATARYLGFKPDYYP